MKKVLLSVNFAVYITLLIVESVFIVPYNSVMGAKLKDGALETIIIGSGYSSMFEIESNSIRFPATTKLSNGRIVNTNQLLINLSITTLAFVAACYLLKSGESNSKRSPKIIMEEYNHDSQMDM